MDSGFAVSLNVWLPRTGRGDTRIVAWDYVERLNPRHLRISGM